MLRWACSTALSVLTVQLQSSGLTIAQSIQYYSAILTVYNQLGWSGTMHVCYAV